MKINGANTIQGTEYILTKQATQTTMKSET